MRKRSYDMVMNIPSPYRLHLFKELHRQMAERGVEFKVHFMNRGHKDRPASWLNPQIEVPHEYWRNFGPDQHEFNPALVLRLIFNPPEWLELGSPYDTFTCILLAFFCRARHIIMGLEGNTKTPGKMGGFIGWFKRKVISRSDFVPVAGSDGARWLEMHRQRAGKSSQFPKTAFMPNVIDESRFHTRAEFSALGASSDLEAIRAEKFGVVADDRVCLIPARFDPVKGLKEFFSILTPDMLQGWRLVIMGHGPDEDMTLRIINDRKLSHFVTVIHSVPYDEMPKYYAAADLMLLPSVQDMNPLTVVEALHAGLPLALSDRAGNVEEGVSEGRNGWVLPVLDRERFKAKLVEVFSTPLARLREMGAVSKSENARYWNTREAVTRLLDAIGMTEDKCA